MPKRSIDSKNAFMPHCPFLYVHGCQRQDLGPLLLSQFRSHDAADSGANGFPRLVDEHAGVVVELDYTAVWPLPLLCCPYHDCVSYIASSHLVRCADGHAVAGFGAKVSLFLHDYYYPVACLCQPLPHAHDQSQPLHIPTFAGRLERSTLTHSTMAAPELSMQFTSV